jgi:predicted metalloprotease with PDZ domain
VKSIPTTLALVMGLGPGAQHTGTRPPPIVSKIEYELTFDRRTALTRSVGVAMRFTTDQAGPVELSLPAWTPGAYEISNFARQVSHFGAAQGAAPLRWEKRDYDTWRLEVPAAGAVDVRFDFAADTLDNAMVWSRPDFAFVNGTNVFLYPEGSDLQFPATVSVKTDSAWRVATAMVPKGGGRFGADNYHDLVDMPFFIGRFDEDSTRIDGAWHRLVSYPAGAFAGEGRRLLWKHLATVVPAMARVFRETPWPSYTTFTVFDSAYGGGSALEHQSSHLGIYNPGFIGNPILTSITAHEIFHAWNVKRLRPADMVPYRYDHAEETTLLWVSEGITDYYADLALVRGGVVDSAVFLNLTTGKIDEVSQVPPISLEDASLSTWIHPTDGTATIYYPKGSLAGFLIDVLIRDATDNRASLDDVMRSLYQGAYKKGRGFTTEEWWQAVSAAAGGKSFADFASRYVTGREPFPWATVAPLAGLRFVADTTREPRLGIATASGEGGAERVTSVVPGSAAAAAGVLAGDELVSVGDIKAGPQFGFAFRAKYKDKIGQTVPVVVRREGRELSMSLAVVEGVEVQPRLEFARQAGLKAARIRSGILTGATERP